MKNKNSIGFIRFFLAGLVIYSHSYYLAGFGNEPLLNLTQGKIFLGGIAVPAFFVLSGILISDSYLRCNSISVFLWHRALRLIPALWVCLIITAFGLALLVASCSGISFHDFLTTKITPTQYVFGNSFDPRKYISIGTTLSKNCHSSDWNGSLWTLFYEASAYLIVAGMGVVGVLTRWRLIGILVISLFLGLFVCNWFGITKSPACFHLVSRLFDTKGKIMIVYFLCGVLWVLLRLDHPSLKTVPLIFGIFSFVLLFIGAFLGFLELVSPFALPPFLLFMADILPLKNFEKKVGGDYSYGLYVYGYPVQQTLVFFGFARFGIIAFLIMSLIVALSMAILSWHLIEKKALSFKNWKPSWSL